MKDFAIIKPPSQNAEAEILHRETDRKSVGYFQRKVVADVLANLNNTLQDAAIEIAIAPRLYENPGFFRMMSYGRMRGMGPAEQSEYVIDLKKRYEEWRRRMLSEKPLKMYQKNGKPMFVMAKRALDVCIPFCQEEHSIDRIRRDQHMGEWMALQLLQNALNEYAIYAGWGDQIETRKYS